MYSSEKVHSLSKPQISRLLNHHGVRIQLGGSLTVHLTKEQSKKLHRAHKKGGGAVITFDPYQVEQHQYLRGKKGSGTRIEDQGVSSNDIANFLGAHQSSDPMADKQVTMNQVKDASKRIKNFLGMGVKKGKGTRLEDQEFTVNDVSNFLGAHESSDPMADKPMTLNQVKDAGIRIKNFMGLGMKKRGRPKKLKGGDLWDDIGNAIIRPVANAFTPASINKVFKPVDDAINKVEEVFKPDVIQSTIKPVKKQFRRGKIKKAIHRTVHDKILYPAASFLIHEGIPAATGTIGGIAGSMMSGGPVGGLAGSYVGEQAGNQLANYVGNRTGLGINIGVGTGQKKRKNKSKKGSALYNAGYMK